MLRASALVAAGHVHALIGAQMADGLGALVNVWGRQDGKINQVQICSLNRPEGNLELIVVM